MTTRGANPMTENADENPWPAVSRTLHLPGGLRVEEVEPGKARFGPIGAGAGDLEIAITSYAAIGNDQRNVTGLPVLGCEIFRTLEELDGLAQPSWRPIVPRRGNLWPTEKAELNWSGLSHSAFQRGQVHPHLIAGAITSQCRFASMRLLDLSNNYLQNIHAMLRSKEKLSEDVGVRGYFGDRLYTSIHAAFFEIATLRDYISEYIAALIYSDKADSMDQLYRFLRDKRGFNTPLEKEIEAINDAGGLAEEFLRTPQHGRAPHAV